MKTDGRIVIGGDLIFCSVMTVLGQILEKMAGHTQVTIDMSKVKAVDSAALAMLLECMREAKKHTQSLSIIAVPQSLRVLAKVSGLDTIIPLK